MIERIPIEVVESGSWPLYRVGKYYFQQNEATIVFKLNEIVDYINIQEKRKITEPVYFADPDETTNTKRRGTMPKGW